MNEYTNLTDEELMVLLIHSTNNSKSGVFEELYKRYNKRLLAYFIYMLNDKEKSEDFLHDLFLKVIDKANLFDTNKRFSVWVYSIAMNMCKNEFRSVKLKKNKNIDAIELKNETEVEQENDENKIFRRRLRQEVEKLDENHKNTFIMRYNLEMNIREISQIMQCSEGTVKSRLFYTQKKLMQNLKNFQ